MQNLNGISFNNIVFLDAQFLIENFNLFATILKIMVPRKPTTDQRRLPKKTRAKKPPIFQMTERDVELVRAVSKYRYLYVEQFAWLFPGSSQRGLENRLRLLFHNKYLNRVVLVDSLSRKLIYAMTEKGARLLAEKDGVSREEIPWQRHLNQVSMAHIRHLLSVNDVVVSLESALSRAVENRRIELFKVLHGDPEVHKLTVTFLDKNGARYNSSVIPDAVVGIKFRGGEFGLFFVEVDRATMTINRWQDKVAVYYEYSRSPELKERFHIGWFIVLTVTTSGKRVLSLAERTVALGGRRAFWYTTADKIVPDEILAPIWVRASDLFQLRNELVYPVASLRESPRVSITDAIGG